MSAMNALGYYLLKRAQQHIIGSPELNWDAHRVISSVIDKQFIGNRSFTCEEQELVFAVTNYQRYEDVPDGEAIGPCVEVTK